MANHFTNLKSVDEIDWTFLCSHTPSSRTGPTRDHTTGDPKGCFAFIETSGEDFGERAMLSTKNVLKGHQDGCSLTLWWVYECACVPACLCMGVRLKETCALSACVCGLVCMLARVFLILYGGGE